MSYETDPLDLVDYEHTAKARELAAELSKALGYVLARRDEYEDTSTTAMDAESRYRKAVEAAHAARSALDEHVGNFGEGVARLSGEGDET